MTHIQRRLCSCLILALAVFLPATTTLYGQTPETKTKPSGSISGRVTIGEKPAPGILVVVGGTGSSTPMAQATSDAEGNYRLNGLAAGQVSVAPVAPVYVVPSSPMFGQGRVVNLGVNESVEGIDFKLARGGVITGRITDADGKPVIEERLNLIAVDEKGAPARNPNVRPSSFMMLQTDDRGIYRIYGLPAGRFKVSVGDDGRNPGSLRASGYYQRVYYPDASDITKAAIVDVSEGGETKNIDIKLGRRASTFSVSGRIVEADTGKPLPNVYPSYGSIQQIQGQSYIGGTSAPPAPTNSQGEFRLEGLTPGRYAIMINVSNFIQQGPRSAPNVYSDPFPFEITDGDVTNLEIKAQRGLSISGVIVTDGITDKSVLARLPRLVIVALVNPGPGGIRTITNGSTTSINPDGSFSLEGLHPGKVAVDISFNGPDAPGLTMTHMELGGGVPIQNREVDLSSGQNISGLKIYLAHGTGVVRGQIKVEGGTLPTDAMFFVSVSRQGEFRRLSGQVDSRGRFVIKGIPPGTYEALLQPVSMGGQPASPLPRPQRQTITVVDGSETEVFFTVDLSRKDIP